MKNKRIAIAFVIAAALTSAACSSAAEDSSPDSLHVVKTKDGKYECVLWSPYSDTASGNQMECFNVR